MAKPSSAPLDYEKYLDERRELYKFQQAEYDSFARTLTTLAGSFLAFSAALLGYLAKSPAASGPLPSTPTSPTLLIGALIAFSAALAALLMVFFVNARSFTVEIVKLEDALQNIGALERPNCWRVVSFIMYGISGTTFLIGLILLVLFCKFNLVF